MIRSFRSQPNQRLYEEFLHKIRTFIHNLLVQKVSNPSDREELTQEILLSIHKSLHTYDDSKPFTPWFYSIVRFKTIDHWRASAKRKTQSLDDTAEMASRDHIQREMSILAADVIDKMNELPPIQREILYLAKVEGFSIAEIAQKTGKKESAIKVTIHRVLKNIRGKLS